MGSKCFCVPAMKGDKRPSVKDDRLGIKRLTYRPRPIKTSSGNNILPPMRHSIPYHPELALRLHAQAGAPARPLWLRPGTPQKEVFCAFPARHIQLESGDREPGRSSSTQQDAALFWRALPGLLAGLPKVTGLDDLPFRGGLAGFIAYDSSSPARQKRLPFPDAYLGLYPHFIYLDHAQKRAIKVSLPGHEETQAEWEALLANVNTITNPAKTPDTFYLSTDFQPLTSPSRYREDFARIQHYLQEGDSYQVNYAQAFRARCHGNTETAMQQLLNISNATHAAWLSLPEGEILSLSPELFIQVEHGRITTKPIKGTAPRSDNQAEDIRLRQSLQDSRKNQAENLMIVDLLRHDISRHAQTGSVKVEKLFEVESLPQVHHLVSTITANLKSGSQSIDLIKDCFPGGSITGAPKKRAMEIIAELEPTPRSVYCGSIGFINADGDAHLNIAIRTLLRLGDEIYTWAGGGIVSDSDCESEYQECFDKIGALMRTLEEMGKP